MLPAEATALLAQPSIAASAAHDRLIAVLAQLHALRYAPQVPALALALLRALPEAEAFAALQALLRAQASAARADGALPALLLSRREEHAFIKTFRTLVKSYHPRLSAHLEALGAPVRAVYASWFRGFFAGWLPPDDVVRVVDAYLLEGTKVLLRVGLALLRATKRKLKATTAPGDIDRVFRRWVARAVCLRAAAGAAPAPHGLAPALLAELASPAAADPLLPDEYSWPALSAGAFDGVTGLARGTIRKLLDKYLAAALVRISGCRAHARIVRTSARRARARARRHEHGRHLRLARRRPGCRRRGRLQRARHLAQSKDCRHRRATDGRRLCARQRRSAGRGRARSRPPTARQPLPAAR